MPLGLKGIFGPSIKFSNNGCLDYEYARKTCIIINYMSMYTWVLNSVLNFDHQTQPLAWTLCPVSSKQLRHICVLNVSH